jgi:hypothetical protein
MPLDRFPGSPTMSRRRRRALEMLADAGQRGLTDPLVLERFTPELLELVRDGLATSKRDTMTKRGRRVEVDRVRITDTGRMGIV